jgi:hypothetical protein
MTSDPTAKLAVLDALWSRKYRERHSLPRRRDILPEELGPILPDLVLWQALDGGADFICRVCGENVAAGYGLNQKGWRLSELSAANPSAAVFGDNFREVMVGGQPIMLEDAFLGEHGTRKQTVALIAPLANDAGGPEWLLCHAIFLAADAHRWPQLATLDIRRRLVPKWPTPPAPYRGHGLLDSSSWELSPAGRKPSPLSASGLPAFGRWLAEQLTSCPVLDRMNSRVEPLHRRLNTGGHTSPFRRALPWWCCSVPNGEPPSSTMPWSVWR